MEPGCHPVLRYWAGQHPFRALKNSSVPLFWGPGKCRSYHSPLLQGTYSHIVKKPLSERRGFRQLTRVSVPESKRNSLTLSSLLLCILPSVRTGPRGVLVLLGGVVGKLWTLAMDQSACTVRSFAGSLGLGPVTSVWNWTCSEYWLLCQRLPASPATVYQNLGEKGISWGSSLTQSVWSVL